MGVFLGSQVFGVLATRWSGITGFSFADSRCVMVKFCAVLVWERTLSCESKTGVLERIRLGRPGEPVVPKPARLDHLCPEEGLLGPVHVIGSRGRHIFAEQRGNRWTGSLLRRSGYVRMIISTNQDAGVGEVRAVVSNQLQVKENTYCFGFDKAKSSQLVKTCGK